MDASTGPADIDYFERLKLHVADTCWRWKTWKQLYMLNAKGEEDAKARMALMQRTAGVFFGTLKRVLLNDVILNVCHLADPPTTKVKGVDRENLSLENALRAQRALISTQAALEADLAFDEFKKSVQPLKVIRDKKISHTDKASLTEPMAVRDAEIDLAIEAAIRMMEALDPNSPSVSYGYQDMIAHGDADALLHFLHLGHQAWRDRFKK